MKFWARIRLIEGEDTQPILVAFFQEYKPGNVIKIEGKNVSIEVDFDEQSPPKEIPEAIGGYSDIDFGCGELSENFGQTEQPQASTSISIEQNQEEPTTSVEEQKDEPSESSVTEQEQEEDVPAPSSSESEKETSGASLEELNGESINPLPSGSEEVPTSVSMEPDETKVVLPEKREAAGGRGKVRKAPAQIAELDKIAEGAISYQAFAIAVAKWLELGKREKFFVDLVLVAATVEKISWTPIDKEMGKKGYYNLLSIRQQAARQIVQKLSNMGINCTFIALVEYVTKYKNFDFDSNISKKVKQILVDMGLENMKPEVQEAILKIANTAVRTENLENARVDSVYELAGFEGKENIDTARMTLFDFVNAFCDLKKKTNISSTKDFLAKLKEAVVTGEPVL